MNSPRSRVARNSRLNNNDGENYMLGILKSFRQEVGMLVDYDIIDADYKKVVIDENVIFKTKSCVNRHRCSQRIGKGLFFTDSERKNKTNEMRLLKLP